jgi:hypothetical protein
MDATGLALVPRAVARRPPGRDVDSTTLEAVIDDLGSHGRLMRSSRDGDAVRCAPADAVVVDRIVAALAPSSTIRRFGDRPDQP